MSQSKLERLWRSYASQSRSTTLIRWLGYGLLLLALLDLVAIVVPYIINTLEFPNTDELTRRVWEFKSIGEVVERIPVPLIGLVMVFWGEQEYRRSSEKIVLKGLTWVTLGMAIVLLALMPLCWVDANRIHQLKIENISTFKGQNLALVTQLETQLNQANSVDEMQTLFNRALNNRSPVALDSRQSLPTVKAQIPSLLAPTKSEIEQKVQTFQAKVIYEQRGLLKRTVKWTLGAVIGAVICLRIWQETRWARKKSYL